MQLGERREGSPSSQAAIVLRFIILAASVSLVAITKNSRHHLPARVVPDPWQTRAVLFKARFWGGLRDGSLTVTYRRWKRPSVKTGGTLVSPGGLLAIDSVEAIDEARVDDDAARRAGYASRDDLFAGLRGDGQLYRIRFHRLGEDPRVDLRERAELTAPEWKTITRPLQHNEWALPYLQLIQDSPGIVSTELASRAGRRAAGIQAEGQAPQGPRPDRKSRGRLPNLSTGPSRSRHPGINEVAPATES